ncbi:hypothetical protein IQ241_05150 [Romeria aff. gracilis LEGE 07310]|uniref:DUF4175 domain-containing protein n=2 Tax=Vasconcelosia TaxID=3366328 RepID=A0A8J7AL86_9CYAN|nr:hypothetical protein [Romeria aff. gracilis LEGE 07310]
MTRRSRLQPGTQLFLALLGLTLGVWVLRGIGILAFIPGIVLWFLILACLTAGVLNMVRSMR